MGSQQDCDEQIESRQPDSGHRYGTTYLSGKSRAVFGNVYCSHQDLKGLQGDEEWKLLLTALCYESMNDKKHHIHVANASTCDWLWSTIFARWLRVDKAKVFWISGKPGSGKSTLMKYLSRSNVTRDKLPKHPSSWIVIDFFFDFRLAGKTANSPEGLLRSLLHQIVKSVPEVGESLRANLDATIESSLESLKHAFEQALNLTKRRFLVLVDGLDEYTGKYGPLLKFLLSLKRCQHVKLCFASRPEPVIRDMLEGIPRIAMSDHNVRGIEKYINIAVEEFQPQLDALLLPNIKELILQRADGVFLWVHLTLDEILEACIEGATPEELHQKLDILPTEIEQLYQRILDRMPLSRKYEAATIFAMISVVNKPMTLNLLRHTMYFMAHELGIMYLPLHIIDGKHFERRLHGTMRGLIDLVPSSGEEDLDGVPKSFNVRLVHETLRSYFRQSGWPERNLPPGFRQVFPDSMWLRICSKALLTTDIYLASSIHNIVSTLAGIKIEYHEFVDLVTGNSANEGIAHWILLLHHSVTYIPLQAEEAASSSDEWLKASVEASMRSSIASIHYGLVGHHHIRGVQPKECSYNPEMNDLMLAASHEGYQYLRSHLKEIAALSDDERRELATMIMLISGKTPVCPAACSGIEEDEPMIAKNIIDTILSFDERISTFHLGAYLRVGYADMPQFLHHKLIKAQQCQPIPPKIPTWVGISPLFAHEPALFIWVCEYTGSGFDNFPVQLQTIASFGLDINSKCSTGHNVVHYIITKHIIGHTFLEPRNDCDCWPGDNIAESIEKLYAVEKAGANFSDQFKHRTPLQAFRHGLDLVHRAKKTNFDVLPEARFTQLEFMLEHKEATGHLPQPMLGTRFWESKYIPRLLERKCDVCSASLLAPDTTPQSAPSSNTSSPSRPRRPKPSRIPRPRPRPPQGKISNQV
ncbi:hypothetical protein H2198_000183 [Neophaeococcomyces mojaviensis]|uniref:Uncharacterized protein n=1 Tax=Neophaeococcomyces mojaviensis TaxID=3383035 RepID=A0ACC3AL60_9EURO|nr:hypothetical protein H2198_000183 [Knufia sp. JES_112]